MVTDAPASQAACATGATSKGLAASTATASPGRTPFAANTRAPAHAAACTWAQLVRIGSCGSPVVIPASPFAALRRASVKRLTSRPHLVLPSSPCLLVDSRLVPLLAHGSLWGRSAPRRRRACDARNPALA